MHVVVRTVRRGRLPAARGVMAGAGKALFIGAVVFLGLFFWTREALPYLLDWSEATFGRFWPRRSTLMLHITGGSVALLMGPLQFWSGLKRRFIRLHRGTGYLYLGAVLLGSVSGFYLAPHTALGWPFAAGLLTLNFAWLLTTGVAYAAIRWRDFSGHRDWMIRSYVVTFGFVTFRALLEVPGVRAMGTPVEVAPTIGWISWVVPLLVTEAVIQLRSMRRRRSVGVGR